jgi:hypothetical protein
LNSTPGPVFQGPRMHSPSCISSLQRPENYSASLTRAAATCYPRRSAQSHAPKAAKDRAGKRLAQMGISTPPAVTGTWKTIRSSCRRAMSQKMTKEKSDAGFCIFRSLFSRHVRLTLSSAARLNRLRRPRPLHSLLDGHSLAYLTPHDLLLWALILEFDDDVANFSRSYVLDGMLCRITPPGRPRFTFHNSGRAVQ